MTRSLHIALFLVFAAVPVRSEVIDAEVCVFGGTAGGVSAACSAARLGKTAVIAEYGRHLGGLTSGGLGYTDIGNKAAIGGFSRNFYKLLGQHYGRPEAWTFEPHVAEQTLRELLKGAGVSVYLEQRLASVRKDGARIRELVMENGNVFRAKMFIDCTYEGDLMAKAGVKYMVGREANARFGETLNGVRENTPKHQFSVAVDPFITRGNPASGLLPFVQSGDGGKPGAGDHRVQTYNFRLCLTKKPENKRPIDPPPGYDSASYELLGRYLEALIASGHQPKLGEFLKIDMVTPEKTDVNNNGAFSTDFIGANYEYPEADYRTRERIWKEHENYIRGLLTFLASDSRVPEEMRIEMQQWGLCRDEFADTGGWPHAMYVREARRMLSDYVMTEKHCRGSEVAADVVGLGAYNMDSHNCQRLAKNGRAENEGDVQVGVKPYGISYRSIVPRAAECENLFVPVCLAATHIAYGSIRMEPVFMILGQSAATAAHLAIEGKVGVQQVDYARLREQLVKDGQVLKWDSAAPGQSGGNPGAEQLEPVPKLDGIVLDDSEAQRTGEWQPGSLLASRRVGFGYIHDANAQKGAMTVRWVPIVKEPGSYELFLHFPPNPNRATNVPVTIERRGGEPITVKVNQQKQSGVQSLGKFSFAQEETVTITLSNKDTDGHVIADGLQLLKR